MESTTFFEGYELHYSYSNCDGTDTFTGSVGGNDSGSESGGSSSSGAIDMVGITAAGLALSMLYLC